MISHDIAFEHVFKERECIFMERIFKNFYEGYTSRTEQIISSIT